jgi:hypothetical protein
MEYKVADIINKTVDIAIRRRTIYENMGQEKSDVLSIKILSKVLIKEVDRTIEYYTALLKELSDLDFEDDFSEYDKMINDLNEKRVNIEEITKVREYMKLSLELEKSLLMYTQSGLVKNTNFIHTETSRKLSDYIDIKAKHIAMVEEALK